MKILFSVGELEKSLTAPTKIVKELADRLAQLGHQCQICGSCTTFDGDEKTDFGVELKRLHGAGFVVKSSDAFERFIEETKLSRNSARTPFVKKYPWYAVGLFLKYHPLYMRKVDEPLFMKKFMANLRSFNPDILVAVCKPINKYEAVLHSDVSVPKFAYQLDPWGMHRIDNPENNPDIVNAEVAAYKKCRHIFTTPILLEQYRENNLYKDVTDRMTAVEFPNIKQLSVSCGVESAIDFDKEYINILFSGIITDEFRSPEHILKNLEPAFDKGEKIRVYFMGTNNSAVLDRYMEKYPENVLYHNQVSVDTAFATMEKADVLLNISNAVDNLVPSKIFDYFSMGKPILNLQKIENCPAQQYFDRYPVCFTLKEWQPLCSDAVKEFLLSAKGVKVDFDHVEKIYADATVEYVADVMEKIFAENLEN